MEIKMFIKHKFSKKTKGFVWLILKIIREMNIKKEGEPNKALVFYDSLRKQLFDVF